MRYAAGIVGLLLATAATGAQADPSPWRVVDRIAGADGGWDYASVDPEMGRLYVARTNAVMMVDLATGKVTDAFAPAGRAHSTLPIDQGRVLVETDGTAGTTRFIDTATAKLIAEVPTGKKPDAAFVDSATGLLVVMAPGSNAVVLIDTKTHAVVRTITVPGGLEAGAGDGKGHAFINLEESNALAEVDLNAGKLVRTIPLTGCDGPTGLAIIGGGRVISACANGVVTMVDPAVGKVVQSVPVGKGPDAVILDSAHGLAWVPAGQSGDLTAIVIDKPLLQVVATIPTARGARTGAIDPRTGRSYLPSAEYLPAKPGERPQAKPGSFTVLVVGTQ